MSSDLTDLLRKQTASHHATSDRLVHMLAPFVLSSPRVYRTLLASFYHVYSALERHMDRRRFQFPKIAPIYFRELLRSASFEADLAFYYSSSNSSPNSSPALTSTSIVNSASGKPLLPPDVPPPSPATQAYIREMDAAVADEPVLLIAYSYTMYMALLSGGKVIRGWIAKAFNLDPSATDGLHIFDFSTDPGIHDLPRFKQTYKDAVNSLSLSDEQKRRIVNQKRRVFECNNSLINEVCWSHASRRRCLRIVFVMVLICVCVWALLSVLSNSRLQSFDTSLSNGTMDI